MFDSTREVEEEEEVEMVTVQADAGGSSAGGLLGLQLAARTASCNLHVRGKSFTHQLCVWMCPADKLGGDLMDAAQRCSCCTSHSGISGQF